MEKLISDFGTWLISSGALVATFVFAWKYLKPILQAKEEHASTLQSKELWDFLITVADMNVSAMLHKDLTGSEKFEKAVDNTNKVLLNNGYNVDDSVIKTAVQSAYEKSPLTGSKQTTSTVTVDQAGVTATIEPADGTATAIDPKEVA
ncbi:hypothetical protein PS395_00775 [Limosilactobacillus pontis]|uniref:hypothetical protein n=1 Tax=Limosilactobacillus pontis TaxID=35787 RepID=UPI002F26CD89